jgi:hypothetical protein
MKTGRPDSDFVQQTQFWFFYVPVILLIGWSPCLCIGLALWWFNR